MKITLKTNKSSVIGNNKHDIRQQMKSKQLISKIVGEFVSQYDIKTIQEIIVYTLKDDNPTLGSVKKSWVNNAPVSVLNLSDLVVGQLHFPQFYSFAYHNIHHEICHIQDYEIICSRMDGNLLSDDYSHEYNLSNFYFINGYKFFGEYIAYRNCFDSYSEQYPNNDLLPQEAQLEIVIQRLFDTYDKTSEIRNFMFNKTIDDISCVVYWLCKHIGYYHASGNKSFLKNIDLIKNERISQYISKLDETLELFAQSYPSWISYDKYIEIGKLFFSVFDRFGITLCENNECICFELREESKTSLTEQITIARSKVQPPTEQKKPNSQQREIGERKY